MMSESEKEYRGLRPVCYYKIKVGVARLSNRNKQDKK